MNNFTETKHIGIARIREEARLRYNPLRNLTPQRITQAMDNFHCGYLSDAAKIYDAIRRRDAIVQACVQKRKRATSRLAWTIVEMGDDEAASAQQSAFLEDFFNNITVSSAADANKRGSMSMLIENILSALENKYAVSEIIWNPSDAPNLSAEVRSVPLWFFENTEGYLRFKKSSADTEGVDLEKNGWMVSVADSALMEATAVCYIVKRYAKYTRGQDSDALFMYPAQEFLRVEPRRVPRTDWQTRWRAAGGKLYGGRMIALKSSDVWKNLSRFDRPYPPFDFGSGMGVEDIDRDEAIALGLLPADEPVDEIPDFDDALETEVSLERIPEDLVKEIVEKTPNCTVEGDKLVMRTKPKLPTFADAGLESAKTWKPSVRETIISKNEAEKKLADGFAVKDALGEGAVFSDETIHWRKNVSEKTASDMFGRLIRLPMAEMCVSQSKEIWQLPNGMRNYVLDYINEKGKFKGVAVSVNPNGDVHTYFIEDIKGLNLFRKGECIYKKKDGD